MILRLLQVCVRGEKGGLNQSAYHVWPVACIKIRHFEGAVILLSSIHLGDQGVCICFDVTGVDAQHEDTQVRDVICNASAATSGAVEQHGRHKMPED